MQINNSFSSLQQYLQQFSWFEELAFDSNRVIAYVNSMSLNIFEQVPVSCEGYQVLVHFVESKPAPPEASHPAPEEKDFHEVPGYLDGSLEELQKELIALDNLCGNDIDGDNIVESLFYEQIDGDDSVTNYSDIYPDAARIMSYLYDQYGYDLILENLP